MNEDQTLQHELNTYSTVNEEIARDTRARQLQSSRLRVALFKGLQSECAEERREALEKIIEVAKSYLRLARSPFSVTSPETPATPPTSSNASKRPSLPSPSILSPNQQKAPIAHEGATGNMYDAEAYDNDEEHQEEDDWTDEQLQYFLLTMLRLSHSCPFNDVRQTFKDFLQMLAATQTKLSPTPSHFSPSIFISLADIFSLESNSSYKSIQSCPRPSNISFSLWSQESDPDNEEKSDVMEQATATGGRQSDEYVRQMMVRTFLDEGRLANLFRVMAFFPTFYEIYRTTYLNITKASIGPLGRSWKCYLGILACAEQKCQYLVSMLKLEFLQSGGDPTWLKSIEYCPPKLQRISRVVLKLARQPWRLTTEDVRSLMSAFGASLGEFWSKGELVQAVVIIATFLGLSSFTLACGIAPEMDMRGGFSVLGSHEGELEGVEHELDLRTPLSPGRNMEIARAAASAATGWHDSDILFEEGRQEFSSDIGRGLGVSVDEDDNDEPEQNEDVIEHTSELIWKLKSTKDSAIKEELLESFEKVNLHKQDDTESDNGKQKLTIDTMTMQEGQKEQTWSSNPSFEDFTRFMHAEEDQQILLENFEAGHNGCEEFMLSEYCWEDHGCDLVNQFLPGLGEELDEEFNEALSITDWSIFHQVADGAVDTSPLRNAIWYYTQQLLGIVKEDYDYEDIGKFLNARNKEYIKKVCQQPSQVRRNDWNNIGLSLRPEEKCHMNLLIASAKKQALLCYGLSIVSQM